MIVHHTSIIKNEKSKEEENRTCCIKRELKFTAKCRKCLLKLFFRIWKTVDMHIKKVFNKILFINIKLSNSTQRKKFEIFIKFYHFVICINRVKIP